MHRYIVKKGREFFPKEFAMLHAGWRSVSATTSGHLSFFSSSLSKTKQTRTSEPQASPGQNQRKSRHPLLLPQRISWHEPRQRAIRTALAQVRLEGVVQRWVEGFELQKRGWLVGQRKNMKEGREEGENTIGFNRQYQEWKEVNKK
jgi:hypothetical protein